MKSRQEKGWKEAGRRERLQPTGKRARARSSSRRSWKGKRAQELWADDHSPWHIQVVFNRMPMASDSNRHGQEGRGWPPGPQAHTALQVWEPPAVSGLPDTPHQTLGLRALAKQLLLGNTFSNPRLAGRGPVFEIFLFF